MEHILKDLVGYYSWDGWERLFENKESGRAEMWKEIHGVDFPETKEEYLLLIEGLKTEGNEEKLFQTYNLHFSRERFNEKSYWEEPVFEGF